MSIESAKAFFEKMKNDEALRKQVLILKTPEEICKLAGANGFEISVEDLVTVNNERAGKKLQDKELAQVSGGIVQAYPSIDFD